MQPLQPSNMQFAKHTNHDKQQVILPENTPFESVYDPRFWAFVAKRFSPFDEVQVVPEDGAWIAELYVIQCDDFGARMALRSKIDLESIAAEDAALPEGYEIKWSGPRVGFSIMRGKDRIYPSSKDKVPATKLDALTWVKNNARHLAA